MRMRGSHFWMRVWCWRLGPTILLSRSRRIAAVYCAVTRMNEAGTQTYFPEEKLTIWQAIYAYTQGSAYAEFAENKKGKLANGYYADFVVLDRDITGVAPPEI